MVQRSARILAAIILAMAGLILLPLPIPLGLPLLLISISLLASDIPWVRQRLLLLRKRYQEFSGHLNHIKHHLPGFVRRLIEDTDPGKI